MKLAIGCDEVGYDLKEILKQYLINLNHSVDDFGTTENQTILYPDMAFEVAQSVANKHHERAILICGTGIGMAITANKVKGIRAAQVADTYSAERAQKSNNAQIICIGGRVVGPELAKSLVSAWLESSFAGGGSSDKVARIAHYESVIDAK